MAIKMICSKCSSEVSKRSAFCPICGEPLTDNESQAQAIPYANAAPKFPVIRVLGLVGSGLLFIGVFTPIISLPVVGSLNYFQNGRGDGVIILILAMVSVFLTLTNRYRFLLITGAGSLAVLLFTFITFQMRMSEMQSQMKQGMANNPFAGFGDAILNTVQIQWGWAVLLIGAVIVISTALLKETSQGLSLDRQFIARKARLLNQSRGLSTVLNISLLLAICAIAAFIVYWLFTG